MAMINPYLYFDGNCEEAFNFYRSVFGGNFINLLRFRDVPSQLPLPEYIPDRIMHIALPISDETILMGCDRTEEHYRVKGSEDVSIAIQTKSEAEIRNIYKALSAGGKIKVPLERVFWGSIFGTFYDRFGICWMIRYDG